MNTTDAIAAIRAGDFHALLGALDVDQREDVDMTSVGGPVVTIARIGRTLATVTQGGGSAFIPVPEGMDERFAFYAAVHAGQETVRDAQRQMTGSSLNGSTLPLGFTV